MKKRIFGLIVLTVAVLLLAGCGHAHSWNMPTCTEPAVCRSCGEEGGKPLGHKWNPATCLAPQTCIFCGMTQGEKVSHHWVPATCLAPETCTYCKETVGEALGHNLTAANYQHPAHCQTCKEYVGAPLVPDFDNYNIANFMRQGVEYTYLTQTERGYATTEGRTQVTSYQTVKSNDKLFERTGYEWHIVTLTTEFGDSAYVQLGARPEPFVTDYYAIALCEETLQKDFETYWEYEANVEGESANIYIEQEAALDTAFDGTATMTLTYYVHAPEGYDGVVVGLKNSAVNLKDSTLGEKYEKEDFVLFRLTGK